MLHLDAPPRQGPRLTDPGRARTIPNHPLRTKADHVALGRRRNYGRHFVVLVGGVDPYPAPGSNYARAMPFGLTRVELRTERRRRQDEGWQGWELDALLRPSPMAAA